MFKNIFTSKGRIRRTEYALTLLGVYAIYFVYILAISLLNNVIGSNANSAGIIFMLIIYIPMLWIVIAQTVKRSHDIGNSGWFILIPFYSLVLFFLDGNKGTNRFGADPKGRKTDFEMIQNLNSLGKESSGNEGEF